MSVMHGHATRAAVRSGPAPDLVDELRAWSAQLHAHFGRDAEAPRLIDRAVREIERLRASADATRPKRFGGWSKSDG